MSVRDRLDDARLLYAQGRGDGALLNVLVAVAATSRKRYPHPAHGDREAFTKFVAEEMPVISQVGTQRYLVRVPGANRNKWPDEQMPMEDCLYEVVRCNLAHEAVLPDTVEFFEAPGATVIDINDRRIRLSISWVNGLINAVAFAPENAELFPESAAMSDDLVGRMLFGDYGDQMGEYLQRRRTRIAELSI